MPVSKLSIAALAHVNARISELSQQLQALDGDQAGETKSSAGDKFETSREMMQQQRDQLQAQLAVAKEHRLKIELAQRATTSQSIGLGSEVLLADGRRYLIATGVGKVPLPEGGSFWVISAESPLGRALIGKVAGAGLAVSGRTVEIVKVV